MDIFTISSIISQTFHADDFVIKRALLLQRWPGLSSQKARATAFFDHTYFSPSLSRSLATAFTISFHIHWHFSSPQHDIDLFMLL